MEQIQAQQRHNLDLHRAMPNLSNTQDVLTSVKQMTPGIGVDPEMAATEHVQ